MLKKSLHPVTLKAIIYSDQNTGLAKSLLKLHKNRRNYDNEVQFAKKYLKCSLFFQQNIFS